MVAMSLAAQDEKVCLASFEMKPQVTLQRMIRQYAETNPFSHEYQGDKGLAMLTDIYKEFGGWTKKKMWLYDQQGTVKPDQVIAVGRYCAKELGVTHYFIDSLTKCVRGEDDYNGQKEFVDRLTALARDNGIHVHLVHHLKKLSDENAKPGKFDAKGSGAIGDLVDNMMIVWRNKAKEDKRQAGLAQTPGDPDALLMCRKQRNGDDEPITKLWFDRDSTQFVAEEGARLLYMPLYPHRRS
jgi:twinkle protein